MKRNHKAKLILFPSRGRKPKREIFPPVTGEKLPSERMGGDAFGERVLTEAAKRKRRQRQRSQTHKS
jgi:hypothetical protein